MNNEPRVKDFRHKYEMPLLILGYALTFFVALSCLIVIADGGELQDWAVGVLVGLVSPIFAVVYVKYLYYKVVSNGIELTNLQFPELYKIYKELAIEMGFTENTGKNKIPPIYLVNGNGVMNAFAAKCALREKYIVVHSDIVDIAYMQNDFGVLKFVLAHELGHIKCGHVNLKRLIVAPVLTLLFLNKSLTRAQEYTADRVASYYAKSDVDGMIYLYAGKNLGNNVNLEEYFKTIKKHDKNLFLRLVNFRSDHAVGFRRMKALQDTKEKGWNVHGKML